MVTVKVSLSEEELQALMRGDRGLRDLMTSAYNEVLEEEMTEHLGAEPNERTEGREGYRNGHYTRSLVTRMGPLTLRVPPSRDGSFSTKVFQRYQRSEKALVLALMEMMVNGVSTRKDRRDGLQEKELPPLDSPQAAERWVEVVDRAVTTGRLDHHEAKAAVREFLRAHDAGEMAKRVENLEEKLTVLQHGNLEVVK